jgi:RHS repeat-associated protein
MSKTCFLWDPIEDNIVKELDGGGATVAHYTTEPDHFGDVISQTRAGVGSQFHYDAQGSTLAITNDDQSMTASMGYTAFGDTVDGAGSMTFPLQYIGQKGYYRDIVTGRYDVRRRCYAPAIARWLSPDTLDVLLHEARPYVYATNRPAFHTDPSGEFQDVIYLPRVKVIVRASLSEVPFVEKDDRFQSYFHVQFGIDPPLFSEIKPCCCDTVGIVQVASGYALAYNATALVQKVDVGPLIDKSIPYPGDKVRKPCSERQTLESEDYPGLNGPLLDRMLRARWVIVNQKFETCVVCLEGREGLLLHKLGITRMYVYGCITWDHMLWWSEISKSYTVRRRLMDKSDVSKLGAMPKPLVVTMAAAEAPTEFFRSGVYAYPNMINA